MKKMMLACLVIAGFVAVVMAANEINISAGIVAQKGYANVYKQPGSIPITWNGSKAFSTILSLSDVPVALSKGAVVNVGYCYARNNDQTNTVALSSLGVTNLIFKPGEFALFRLSPDIDMTAIYANCISNAVVTNNGLADFEFTILED
jgi:hypothetical protein